MHPSLPKLAWMAPTSNSQTVRNLGVTLVQILLFQQYILNIRCTYYLELCRIGTICKCLSEDATKTLTCTFMLSRLDYYNALLSGSPKHLNRLQKVQNSAAWLIYRSYKFNHVAPLVQTLHWLPIENRIDFKLALLCFKSLTGSAPTYLSDLHLYTPSLQLCSSADTWLFRIPSFCINQVVSALSLTKLQQHGTSFPLLSVTHPLSVPSDLPRKPFSFQKLFLQSPCPEEFVCVKVCVCVCMCVCASVGAYVCCLCIWIFDVQSYIYIYIC